MPEFIEKYFSFHGRLARLPYFTRGLQIAILFSGVFFPGLMLLTSENRFLWWLGLLPIVIAAIILVIGSVSLAVRRLHDIGLTGYHAIWIVPLLAVPVSGESALALLLIVPGLWLTCWPGRGAPNRFDA